MFVSIFGLPLNITYSELKTLIKQQCNLIDVIIDNIISASDGRKKVRIGLATEEEAIKLIKGLDGYRLQGNHILKVVPMNKNPSTQGFESQTYQPMTNFDKQGGNYHGSQRPLDPNRPQPWAQGVQNVWSQDSTMGVPQNQYYTQQGYEQPTFQTQHPDPHFMQGRSHLDQFGEKPNYPIDPHTHVAHNLNLVDPAAHATPSAQQGRYPPVPAYQQHDKPVTMKDAHQPRWEPPVGSQRPGHYQGQPHSEQSWAHQNPVQYDDDRRGPVDKRDPKYLHRKPSPGRPEPGRIHGRPVSPSRPGLHGRMSPEKSGRIGRPRSPGGPGMAGRRLSPGGPLHGKNSPPGRRPMRPGSPGLRSGRPGSPGLRSGRPGSPGLRSGRPGSPGPRSGRPGSPGLRSGRPGSPSLRSGRPGSPGLRSGRPGSPGLKSGRPGSPSLRQGRQGSPNMRSGRPVSPSMRPVRPDMGPGMRPSRPDAPAVRSARPGSPGLRSGRPGSPDLRESRPGSPSIRPGRPISQGMRSGRPDGPVMRSGRPGSPGIKLGRPMSPGRRAIDQRADIGRPVSPRNAPKFLGRDQRPGRPASPERFDPGRRSSPRRPLLPNPRPEMGRPSSPGRLMSHGRVPVHPGRPGSPLRRGSPGQRRPGDRIDSPRRISPHRYSPDRHRPDHDPFDQELKTKLPRPAYDTVAPSKAIYPGGFRPNTSEIWQKSEKYTKVEDESREGRGLQRGIELEKRMHPADHKPRSPARRDRSPLKDHRFKRHSPSPRSPRRSWALEKRRSPEIREAPPPPVWPGQSRAEDQYARHNIHDRNVDERTKHESVWEIRAENKNINRRHEFRRSEQEERRFEERGNRPDIVNRELRSERFAPGNDRLDKFKPQFSPREIDDRSDFNLNDEKRFNERQERRDFQRRSADREDRYRDGHQRNVLPHRIDDHSVSKNFDQELEDIYKRAVEFRKKADEMRRSDERRRDDFRDERHDSKEDLSRRPASPGRRDYHGTSKIERRQISRDIVEWKVENNFALPENVRVKREKAANEIINRLLERQTVCNYIEGEFALRVKEELQMEILKIIQTLFANEDVSFIEIIIKYQAKFSLKDEELMLRAVLNSLPTPHKTLKRHAEETNQGEAKTARQLSPTAVNRENPRPRLSDAFAVDWTVNIEPPKLAAMPTLSTPMVNSHMPLYNTMDIPQFSMMPHMMLLGDQQPLSMSQNLISRPIPMQVPVNQPPMVPAPYETAAPDSIEQEPDEKDVFHLYLCHDDFQPFNTMQAEELKRFLFSKIVAVTESSRGWAPDITIKGLQSLFRYELLTRDIRSRDWLLSLDFSDFFVFDVVVYTKEELWYERAAIWLPGHSRSRNIEPMEKLRLQNKALTDINIGKWKLVKKIVNEKGTRLFVDMPPSSARALDKYKMMLSYELQKVNVFLRAVAVDKEAFDTCMREYCITDKNTLNSSAQNAPLPVINNTPTLVKITLSDSQSMTIEEARKIKEVVIYHIFRYHKMNGNLRTDFVKYGFCKPHYFAIVPENNESKKWLLSRNFGKLKNNDIVVVGADEDEIKSFPMKIIVSSKYSTNASKILERLKSSNKGVKGLYFNRWKVDQKVRIIDNHMVGLEILIDIDSLKTLKNMKYQLDYVNEQNKTKNVKFKSIKSLDKLEDELKKHRNEMEDIYDVSNMEIDSGDETVISLE